MNIRSTHSTHSTLNLRRAPDIQPQTESVTLSDQFVQRGAGALATGVPSSLGLAGAAIGEAVAGTPGKIVGGPAGNTGCHGG